MEFNFGLGVVAVATSPGIMPKMEPADHSDGIRDHLESRTAAFVHGTTIHCADNGSGGAGPFCLGSNPPLRSKNYVRH